MVHAIRKADTEVTELGCALQLRDTSALQEKTTQFKTHSKKAFIVLSISVNKSEIFEQFKRAFTAYHKHCLEQAEFPCMSCTKLCFPRQCVQLERYTNHKQ